MREPADTGAALRSRQQAFAEWLRDPDRRSAPAGVDPRRLAVYRRLFFNTVAGLLAGNFPVLRVLHDEAAWRSLVRAWYAGHRARSPLFPEVGSEFVAWLQARQALPEAPDPPWLAELAHYEYMEIHAANAEAEIADVAHDPEGDLLAGAPVVSPLAWPLAYRWPVHRLGAEQPPQATAPAQPTCLVVVRDRRDRVGFLEANALTLRLLELLRERPAVAGADQFRTLATEAGLAADALLVHGRDILARLLARDIVLGTAV
ncbi:MAG: putative DNA-binding domain-containing protein [Xanthomonadales bacterium]|nr:putative DNA-binding domain-containing protein [Xanthomonadales bacterium]